MRPRISACSASCAGARPSRLNPAWERTLGYSLAEPKSRPFVDFVHPDDRERTRAKATKLAEDGVDTVNFRNRYLCRDGSYRRLDWTAHGDPEDRLIYASAREPPRGVVYLSVNPANTSSLRTAS